MKLQLKIAGMALLMSAFAFTAKAQMEDPSWDDQSADDITTLATCITREDQIYTSPRIEAIVKKIGGVRNLEGQWRLGGFEGNFKRVILSFVSEADSMKALIEGLDNVKPVWGALTVCETNKADVVHIQIYGQQDSIFMRGVSSKTIQIAQIEDGKAGSFYSFDKIR